MPSIYKEKDRLTMIESPQPRSSSHIEKLVWESSILPNAVFAALTSGRWSVVDNGLCSR